MKSIRLYHEGECNLEDLAIQLCDRDKEPDEREVVFKCIIDDPNIKDNASLTFAVYVNNTVPFIESYDQLPLEYKYEVSVLFEAFLEDLNDSNVSDCIYDMKLANTIIEVFDSPTKNKYPS